MPSIFEDLTGLLSSSVTKDLGKSVGLKPDLVGKAVGVIGPLVTAALANKASTPSGQTELMELLPKDGVASIVGNLAKSVATLLGTETSQFPEDGRRNGSPRPGRARRRSASDRRSSQVLAGPVGYRASRSGCAAHMVITADKSGPVGAIKEISAATGAITDAAKAASPASLVSLAFDHDFTVEELTKFTKARTPDDALTTVRDAIASVERNSPADAPTYRQLVADVATKVANASKEGGILGFGGVAVSPAEQAALDQLRSVIGER